MEINIWLGPSCMTRVSFMLETRPWPVVSVLAEGRSPRCYGAWACPLAHSVRQSHPVRKTCFHLCKHSGWAVASSGFIWPQHFRSLLWLIYEFTDLRRACAVELWADPAPWWSSSSHDASSHMELQTEDKFIFLLFPLSPSHQASRWWYPVPASCRSAVCRPLTLFGLTRWCRGWTRTLDWLIDWLIMAHDHTASLWEPVDQIRVSLSDVQIHLALLYNLLFCVSG